MHEDVIYSFLSQHTPIILVGPPGSGKSMYVIMINNKSKDTFQCTPKTSRS